MSDGGGRSRGAGPEDTGKLVSEAAKVAADGILMINCDRRP
jgi:hypothetical protein